MQEIHNALPTGHILYGSYEIVSILGAGGFGITYKVKDINLGVYRAIKEYMPSQFASRSSNTMVTCNSSDSSIFEWGLKRFLDEAKTVANFNFPSIVKVLTFFEENNSAYFVMEYYEGKTLERYLKESRNRQFSEDEILSIMMPIIEGLKEVHRKGYLHRDIAPDNIFLREQDLPVLIDFGASRSAVGSKTKGMSAIVKHGYSPSEQYTSSSEQDASSDIYALCAVMYEMITGKKPPESTYRLQEVIINGNRDPLEGLVSNYGNKYSKSFLETVQKGLSIKQRDRVQSLEELQEGLVVLEPRIRLKYFKMVILILLVTFGGVLYYIIGTPAPTPPPVPKPVPTPVPKKEVLREKETKVVPKKDTFNKEKLEKFLKAFVDDSRRDAKRQVEYYADIVSPYFLMASATRKTIYEDKSMFNRKWVNRDYSLKSVHIIDTYDIDGKRYYELSSQIEWRVSNSKEKRSGESTNKMTIKEESGKRLEIVAISTIDNSILESSKNIYRDDRTYHLGDENIRGSAWEQLFGRCYSIAFKARDNYRYELSLKMFGVESTSISLNGKFLSSIKPQLVESGKRPNYWSGRVKIPLSHSSIINGENSLSICSDKVARPEHVGDLDDLQIKSIQITEY